MSYTVTYDIEYDKNGKKVSKRKITNWDKLNTELKWIRSKHFDTIKIFRDVRFNDQINNKIICHRFTITLTAYDSSPLKYQQFWDNVQELQMKEIKDAE